MKFYGVMCGRTRSNLKKAEEYVMCFTGTDIMHATIEVDFESNFVQERESPSQ